MIPNYLFEAYEGAFEGQFSASYREHVDRMVSLGHETVEGEKSWVRANCILPLIYQHTPEERLAIYLQWNGILGFASQIYTIATEELG